MHCPDCGFENLSDYVFCFQCGKDLSGTAAAPGQTAEPPREVLARLLHELSWRTRRLEYTQAPPGDASAGTIARRRPARIPHPGDDLQISDIQRARGAFATNRFLGWLIWLHAFQITCRVGQQAACDVLLDELRTGGYELSEAEQSLLMELQDAGTFRQAGLRVLADTYERRLEAGGGAHDAQAKSALQFRLALIYQRMGHIAAALALFRTSKELCEAAGLEQARLDATEALEALELQVQRQQPHPFFDKLWGGLEPVIMDPPTQVRRLAQLALGNQDWRLARQAVTILVHLDAPDVLAYGLRHPVMTVRLATVAGLRQLGARRSEAALIGALGDASRLVRERASAALSDAAAESSVALLAILQRDLDRRTVVEAIRALARTADTGAVESVRRLPIDDERALRLADLVIAEITRLDEAAQGESPQQP